MSIITKEQALGNMGIAIDMLFMTEKINEKTHNYLITLYKELFKGE